MDIQEIKFLVIPLMVALDLTAIGVLVAVVLGIAWD